MFTDFGPWTSPFFDQGHCQNTIFVGLCSIKVALPLGSYLVARPAAKYSLRHDLCLA